MLQQFPENLLVHELFAMFYSEIAGDLHKVNLGFRFMGQKIVWTHCWLEWACSVPRTSHEFERFAPYAQKMSVSVQGDVCAQFAP